MDNFLFASYHWHQNTSYDELRRLLDLSLTNFLPGLVFASKEILRCDFHTVEYVLIN